MASRTQYLEKFAFGMSAARSLNYFVQYQSLLKLTQALPIFRRLPKRDKRIEKAATQLLIELLRKDAENLAQGVYPLKVLSPESLMGHWLRLPKLYVDGLRISWRRDRKTSKSFSRGAKRHAENLPEYYTRNFHFQTDGYLSEMSAELYDHQVELLFSGAADAMRRSVLPELKASLPMPHCRVLELGCGTGSFTRNLAMTLPLAQITALDLSRPYLKHAARRLASFDSIDWLQGDATELPFRDRSFDAVVSVYMFHELPLEARQRVLAESRRVLKPGGVLGFVDSLQYGDQPSLDLALDQFPVDFHEPFFKSYVDHPIDELLEKSGFEVKGGGLAFLSKYRVAMKLAP